MFLEEHIAQQMEDVWELGQIEELCGMVGWRRWSLLHPVSNSNQE
jgi:hypothetical protein